MVKIYRGTQRPDVTGRHPTASWTPALGVAVIYAARPRQWEPPIFVSGSTVHVSEVPEGSKLLSLCRGDSYCTLETLIGELGYGSREGITDEEVDKLVGYLHRRVLGRAPGGEFQYLTYETDGSEIDEAMVPFSLFDPETRISLWRDWVLDEEGVEASAPYLHADTYAFADSPVVRRVARRLGYDFLVYEDIFDSGPFAAEELLGLDIEDLEGVDETWGLDEEPTTSHETLRPLHKGALGPVESLPVEAFFDDLKVKR